MNICYPSTNTSDTFVEFFNNNTNNFQYFHHIINNVLLKYFEEQFNQGFRYIWNINDFLLNLNNITFTSQFQYNIIAESIKYIPSGYFGLKLYKFEYSNQLMNIVIPIYSDYINTFFMEIDSNSINKINNMIELEAPMNFIKNEIINNFALKVNTFREFSNLNDAIEFMINISNFWNLELKFVIDKYNDNYNFI